MAWAPLKSRFWGPNAALSILATYLCIAGLSCATCLQHGPSCLPLGTQFGARTTPRGTRKPLPGATFCYSGRTLIFDNTPMVLLHFWCPAGSQRAVCWHKKSLLRAPFVQDTVPCHFGSDSGAHCPNLGPTWSPRWPPTCRQRGPMELFFWTLFYLSLPS